MAGLLMIGAPVQVVFCAPDFATLMTRFFGPPGGSERRGVDDASVFLRLLHNVYLDHV